MPTPLTLKVIEIIKNIPPGKVLTYGLVAAHAGNPRAARQVAYILSSMAQKHNLPWHRVVNREGRIALKPGQGFEVQKSLLEEEGISFQPDASIALSDYLWHP